MGSVCFAVSGKGVSAEWVFRELCEEAVFTYGSSHYNGSISTTKLGETVAFIDNYNPATDKKLIDKFLNDAFDGKVSEKYVAEKWVSKCIRLTHQDGTKEFVFYGWAAS